MLKERETSRSLCSFTSRVTIIRWRFLVVCLKRFNDGNIFNEHSCLIWIIWVIVSVPVLLGDTSLPSSMSCLSWHLSLVDGEVQFSPCPQGGRQGLTQPFTAFLNLSSNSQQLSLNAFHMLRVILNCEAQHYRVKCTLMFSMSSYHFFLGIFFFDGETFCGKFWCLWGKSIFLIV